MVWEKVKTFAKCDDGAVTVDFVVLTSMTVLMGTAVLLAISSGLHNGSNSVDQQIVSTSTQAAVIGQQIVSGN